MQKNIVHLISYTKNNPIIVGSQADSEVKYKNDTDLYETIITKESKPDLISELHKMLLMILGKMKRNKNVYFMDFKAGTYQALYISDEDILNTKKRQGFYKKKLEEKLITEDILDTIENLKNDELLYFCSNLYKVRWSPTDIKHEYTTLFNGELYRFDEIFNHKSVIKLDILFFDGKYFQPYSNMFQFINNGELLTESPDDVIQSLKEDMQKYINQGNLYKSLKRAYSIAKIEQKEDLCNKLLDIINSKAGQYYQIKSYVENCEEVLSKYPKREIVNKVKTSLEHLKGKYSLEKRFINHFEKAANKHTAKPLLKAIMKLKDILFEKAQELTKKLIEKHNLDL